MSERRPSTRMLLLATLLMFLATAFPVLAQSGTGGETITSDSDGTGAETLPADSAGVETEIGDPVAEPTPPPISADEAQTRIEDLTGLEREAYARLFALEQDIRASETELEVAQRSLDNLRAQSAALESEIAGERAARDNNLEALKALLVAWQRMGPGSSLEVLLDSQDFADFLGRINVLSDLSRNVKQIDAEIEASEARLLDRQTALDRSTRDAEAAVARISELILQKDALRAEQETLLTALAEERGAAEDWLTALEAAWQALKPKFPTASRMFLEAMQNGAFPEDAVSLSISLEGIVAVLSEEALSSTLALNPDFPDLQFRFTVDGIHITDDAGELALLGRFEPNEETKLLFIAESGTFHGMPLEPSSLSELFSEGNLVFDLTPVMMFGGIGAVRTDDGRLILTLK